jgi:hypothetical protein
MKVLLIGLAGSGKTTLSRALGDALDLPVHRLDDYRRWLGDGSIAGDYRARSAFLQACASQKLGIFEFSGVGHHRAAVQLALKEQGAPVHVFCVWCDEAIRVQRVTTRTLDIPFPSWGVGATYDASGQARRLREDAAAGFWQGEPGWTRRDVRGDRPAQAEVAEILQQLGVEAAPRPASAVSSRRWLAELLGVAPAALQEWDNRPAGLQEQPRSDLAWTLCCPDTSTQRRDELVRALEEAGWHPLIAPDGPTQTLLSALSPDLEQHLAVRLPLHLEPTAEDWAMGFIARLERASAYRAASDAAAWFEGGAAALDALWRCWWQARGFGPSLPGEPCPPVRSQLPPGLRKLHRHVAPSQDLANAATEADRIHAMAAGLRDDLMQQALDPAVIARLDDWLPRLRRLMDGRDALWNYRDVARGSGGRLRSGVLFRGSSPSRYHNDPRYAGKDAFERWLAASGVVETIDLRSQEEVDESPYPAVWGSRLTCHHLPIQGVLIDGLGDGLPDMARVYLGFLEAHHPIIRAALQRVAEARGPLLIHCHAGMDRTGVLVALIGYLCDLPREVILRDYLSSGGTTSQERMEAFLDHLAGYGDAEAIARHLSLEASLLSRLRVRMLP